MKQRGRTGTTGILRFSPFRVLQALLKLIMLIDESVMFIYLHNQF